MSERSDAKNIDLKQKQEPGKSRTGTPIERRSPERKTETYEHAPTTEEQNLARARHPEKHEKPRVAPRGRRPPHEQEIQKEGVGTSRNEQEFPRQLSLPPGTETPGGPVGDTQDSDISKLSDALAAISGRTEDDISSLSTTLKEFLPKLIQVDRENKKLKETVVTLEEKLAKTEANIQRTTHSKGSNGKSPSQDEKEHERGVEALRREEEYIKMRRQLKRALDANQGWNDYCKDQLRVHLNQLHTKDEQIRQLQEKLKSLEGKKGLIESIQRQLEELQESFEDSESENQSLRTKNHKLEDEQRQVRKLAKGLMKEKEDLHKEAGTLKQTITALRSVRLTRLPSADSRMSSEDIASSVESHGAKTSSDSGTVLSYPELRNVETTMNVEHLTNQKKNNADSRTDGGTEQSSLDRSEDFDTGTDQMETGPSDGTRDVICFLQEQVQQYRDDFKKERQDRERAVGELDRVRKELEDTKLLLHQQREVQNKKKSKKSLFGGKQKSKPKPEAAGFRFLGPDEVAHLQREQPARNTRPDNQYAEDGNEEPANHVYHEIDDD